MQAQFLVKSSRVIVCESTVKRSPGGGFSSNSKAKQFLPISQEANEALNHAKGNIDLAADYCFRKRLAQFGRENPKLYEKVVKIVSTTRSDPSSIIDDSALAVDKLIEITWDTVALTLPFTINDKSPRQISNRLKAIACSCVRNGTVLDVGCGHGPLVPYFMKKKPSGPGIHEEHIVGIDLSGEMIALATALYPASSFYHHNFQSFHLVGKQEVGTFDTVIFNGSLQFFDCAFNVLELATKWLRKEKNGNIRKGSRIVVAHVNGGNFVADEMLKNPHTVKQLLPSYAQAQKIAMELGFILINGSEAPLEDFYLLIFEKL